MTNSTLPPPSSSQASLVSSAQLDARLRVDVHYRASGESAMAREVLRGLQSTPRVLHPKYLYDERGSRLFDQICDTPEYYPTRTEQSLLKQIADPLMRQLHPASIVELGSGTSRKTRTLLDAAELHCPECEYVPVDVSEEMLRSTATRLLGEYAWLRVHALVADYTQQLEWLPEADGPRLFVFIGSTIGNFSKAEAVSFLSALREQMQPEDHLLLGTDLVKATNVLNAAYNDAAGLTADFNKNVLAMLNRELGANFDLAGFEHHAEFVEERAQVELWLRATQRQSVSFDRLHWATEFPRNDAILTEISRKFTRRSAREMLQRAGLELVDWHTPENDYFALSVSRIASGDMAIGSAE